MRTWNVRSADEAAVKQIAERLGLPRVVARLLWLRGYQTPEVVARFLDARESLRFLETPIDTPGMQKAVRRIRKAVESGEPFVIYGDYDCDGVTSTTVLYRYLKRGLGANCEAYLPDRFKDGYGVTAAAVERLAAQGVKLILTCDNGISAFPAAQKAQELGVDLVVTDHHLAPPELPPLHAVVHPQVEFPHLQDMAGVGVAFLFCLALEGGFTARMEHFLDFVTIGTIGDVVPLNGPNRPLVWAGLERYREGKFKFPGLHALGAVAKTNFPEITAIDVAFQLVPRLNAAGRLETPDVGFKLLATNNRTEAAAHAESLDAINRQRREMSSELDREVQAMIDRDWNLEAEPFIVLADSGFHHGITGIIAGRLKERYRVPVLLFSGHGTDPWKASGRSPEGLHLYEALHASREHLLGYGGHAGAAGCAARPEKIPAIREALNDYVREVGWERPADVVWLDAELPFAEADEALLATLDRMEPFGQKNPAPTFGLMRARVVGRRIVKEKHLFLQLDDGETVREVICWGRAEEADALSGWVKLTYRVGISTFRGERRVQLTADQIEPADAPPPVVVQTVPRHEPVAMEDRRGEDPFEVLESLSGPCSIYALEALPELPEGARLISPLAMPSGALGHVVLVDMPPDEATFLAMVGAAERVTLAWDPETLESPLTPDDLLAVYQGLAEHHRLPLEEAVAEGAPGWLGLAALAVLREAGLLVERERFWKLLAAPETTIGLTGLSSYQAAKEAHAFRLKLATAPLARIRAWAQQPGLAV
ncbi:MAG: single-stranded-DNA-specific exonuclease RecJ [Candidatus Sericytochromatia bacterium]